MPTTPGILTWNRLEPRPRNEDFDRTLKAEVRDPLWMMTRQWQFGEFQAEDTGSAVFSKIHMKTSKLNKMKLGSNAVRDVVSDIPLEADVEKEAIDFDFLIRLEMSRYWENLLRMRFQNESDLGAGTIESVILEFRKTTGPIDMNFYLPAEDENNADFYSNAELWQATALHINGRAFDGYAFYQWLTTGSNDPIDFVGVTLDASDQAIVSSSKTLFIDWLERNYAQPTTTDESAWNPTQLEYQFSLAAPETSGSSHDVLAADEYYHGKLDWYAFDFDNDNTDYDTVPYDSSLVTDDYFTLIPTPVMFSGMPHPRWWQMEDRRVDLGDVNPSTTDTAKIIFSEFGLIYSNDWVVFPYTVNAGSMCELSEVVVTDCFGQRTKVISANGGDDDDWNRWSFFGLNTKGDGPDPADIRIFIPATAHKVMESEPVESVNFIRDEMANMVWGIEKTIPSSLSGGIDGYEAALKYNDYLKSKITPDDVTLEDNNAVIQYRLLNSVPENWIPFVPVKKGGVDSRKIQLQRAAMPRFIEGVGVDRVRPRTVLLQENLDEVDTSYYIHEDEIPRAGVIVKRTWQRTRTEDGTVVVWMGRRKTTGRGEGSSNLAFDQVEDK